MLMIYFDLLTAIYITIELTLILRHNLQIGDDLFKP